MSPNEFLNKWQAGCGSQMCATARHIVLARGNVPADVVFVGEAPGVSEDSSGLPFWGPAGKLMDDIIERAFVMAEYAPSYALCNLAGCVPRVNGVKVHELGDEQVEKCAPRLQDFLAMCNPRLIVCVGRLPEGWLDQSSRYCIKLPASCAGAMMVAVPHPSGILQAESVPQRNSMKNRAIVVIASAVRKLTQCSS